MFSSFYVVASFGSFRGLCLIGDRSVSAWTVFVFRRPTAPTTKTTRRITTLLFLSLRYTGAGAVTDTEGPFEVGFILFVVFFACYLLVVVHFTLLFGFNCNVFVEFTYFAVL